MPKPSYKVKFTIELNLPGEKKKIFVGIKKGCFTDPRSLFITSLSETVTQKTKKQCHSSVSELTKIFGIRLQEYCREAFRIKETQ